LAIIRLELIILLQILLNLCVQFVLHRVKCVGVVVLTHALFYICAQLFVRECTDLLMNDDVNFVVYAFAKMISYQCSQFWLFQFATSRTDRAILRGFTRPYFTCFRVSFVPRVRPFFDCSEYS